MLQSWRNSAASAFAAASCAFAPTGALSAEVTLTPVADGTLVDGGMYGPFDGTADAADWSFNESGYEGVITLVLTEPAIEQRLVFEYNLSALAYAPPVTAFLSFTLRGAPRFPAEPAIVYVYAYPADGAESLADFNRAPATVLAVESIAPYQVATTYVVNVSDVVNAGLLSANKKVAFRFQIDPDAEPDLNQAFMDVTETDQTTKPKLTIRDRVPCDFDDDGDVDLGDYAALAGCMKGPGGRTGTGCDIFDMDFDRDVDLMDLRAFMMYEASY